MEDPEEYYLHRDDYRDTQDTEPCICGGTKVLSRYRFFLNGFYTKHYICNQGENCDA